VYRTLTIILLTLAVLVACAMPPSAVVQQPNPEVVIYTGVQQWLKLQQDIAGMDAEMLDTALADKVAPEGRNDLYHYALLQQHSQSYAAWVNARDAFRQLYADEGLTESQRQLVAIFQAYNQLRINGYQRQSELLDEQAKLQQQLHKAAQDKLLLEQKIQALTELEADISTRREE
jgi:hypothetical protein